MFLLSKQTQIGIITTIFPLYRYSSRALGVIYEIGTRNRILRNKTFTLFKLYEWFVNTTEIVHLIHVLWTAVTQQNLSCYVVYYIVSVGAAVCSQVYLGCTSLYTTVHMSEILYKGQSLLSQTLLTFHFSKCNPASSKPIITNLLWSPLSLWQSQLIWNNRCFGSLAYSLGIVPPITPLSCFPGFAASETVFAGKFMDFQHQGIVILVRVEFSMLYP